MAGLTFLKGNMADEPRNEGGVPETLRAEMAVPPNPRCRHLLGHDSYEQIRCYDVSRFLRKMDLSPEEEQGIEQLSYSLVAKLLLGPISEVMVNTSMRLSSVPGSAAR